MFYYTIKNKGLDVYPEVLVLKLEVSYANDYRIRGSWPYIGLEVKLDREAAEYCRRRGCLIDIRVGSKGKYQPRRFYVRSNADKFLHGVTTYVRVAGCHVYKGQVSCPVEVQYKLYDYRDKRVLHEQSKYFTIVFEKKPPSYVGPGVKPPVNKPVVVWRSGNQVYMYIRKDHPAAKYLQVRIICHRCPMKTWTIGVWIKEGMEKTFNLGAIVEYVPRHYDDIDLIVVYGFYNKCVAKRHGAIFYCDKWTPREEIGITHEKPVVIRSVKYSHRKVSEYRTEYLVIDLSYQICAVKSPHDISHVNIHVNGLFLEQHMVPQSGCRTYHDRFKVVVPANRVVNITAVFVKKNGATAYRQVLVRREV